MNRYLLVCAKITIKEVKKQKCEEREINEPRPNLKVNANYRLRIYWFLVHSFLLKQCFIFINIIGDIS